MSHQNSAGYPYSGNSDLDRRFGEMDVGGRDYKDHKHTGLGRPGKYSISESEWPHDTYSDRPLTYSAGASGYPSTRSGQPYSSNASMNVYPNAVCLCVLHASYPAPDFAKDILRFVPCTCTMTFSGTSTHRWRALGACVGPTGMQTASSSLYYFKQVVGFRADLE